MKTKTTLTSSHWGIGLVTAKDDKILSVENHPIDPNPSDLNANIADGLNGPTRVLRPAIRKGWLEGTGGERGKDAFVEVSWECALDLIAKELERVKKQYGNNSIFAGSYGWASAGRFHHAQSQLKRFLSSYGGFVRSEGNYSYNAALFALPHIVGGSYRQHIVEATRWSVIAEHTKLVVSFGGLAMRNTQICDGGNSRHRVADELRVCAENGVQFINISPLRTDAAQSLNAEWLAVRPGTDTALMLALSHCLIAEGLHDTDFLNTFTVGFSQVSNYLNGTTDGVEKCADWAAEVCGIPADRIRSLAREMASKRTMISCAASLQRADWGEQPLWAGVTLAALLGQIGLPGGGYTVGYAVNGHIGTVSRPFRWAVLPQGKNPVAEYIPVAMVSDMLMNPGQTFRFDGQTLQFPDIRMVWWAGGNPFHHHQDLNRLRAAFQKPETIIVNEINWTSTARHADIVLPVSAAQERTDFGGGRTDNILVPMVPAVSPAGEAKDEFDIYCLLAEKLGVLDQFSEGLSSEGWLRKLWGQNRAFAQQLGHELSDWDTFISGDVVELPDPTPSQVFLSEFRADPVANPRQTPSGKIELYSEHVAGFGLSDCAGHATWNTPREQTPENMAQHPLSLISGQPATRLHSQHDTGKISIESKVSGREPVLINPADAKTRGINSGDVVELLNTRGRCLAGAVVTDDIMPGVAFLWTGAWYDPDFDAPQDRDRHGNPNTLTQDLRTSEFTQGPASHSAQIQVQKFNGPVPEITVHTRPEFES